ncbi:MAG: hypothetical protein B5M56_10020 [Desulfococcus sp. 4484_241]|nr:MAG: hypothetical protein B5M56_10020 [Desulfococcus sp. 4484_241]
MNGTSQIVWGFLFGTIGLGFFVYGKKQKAIVPLLSGIALFIIPYFITNVYLLAGVGILLSVVPFFIKI